jgi:hypothetical protein
MVVHFDISLERNEYAGETAKGTLTISEDKDFKVEGFELSVSGEELIEIKTDESSYKQSNIIFSKDLSDFLKSIGTKTVGDDNENSMLKVAGGSWKVPFEFPCGTLVSHKSLISQLLSFITSPDDSLYFFQY